MKLNTILYCVSSQQDRQPSPKPFLPPYFRNKQIVIITPYGDEHILTGSLNNQLNLAKTKQGYLSGEVSLSEMYQGVPGYTHIIYDPDCVEKLL